MVGLGNHKERDNHKGLDRIPEHIPKKSRSQNRRTSWSLLLYKHIENLHYNLVDNLHS